MFLKFNILFFNCSWIVLDFFLKMSGHPVNICLYLELESSNDDEEAGKKKKKKGLLAGVLGTIDLQSEEGKKVLKSTSKNIGAVKMVSSCMKF